MNFWDFKKIFVVYLEYAIPTDVLVLIKFLINIDRNEIFLTVHILIKSVILR